MLRWVERALTPRRAERNRTRDRCGRAVVDFGSVVVVSPPERFIGPVVRDAHVGLAVPDVDFIGPVSIGFTAA